MARGWIALVVATLLVVTAGTSAASAQSDGFADVLVGDLVIGESEQEFPGVRLVGFDEDAERVDLEIDLSALESHGVAVDDARIDLATDDVRGATVETATVDDGVVVLGFSPDDSIDDAIIELQAFRLAGLDTTAAAAVTNVTYSATFSAGEARVRSFDIVDPDTLTPALDTETLFTGASTHRSTLQHVQATDEDVTVELNVRILEDHGFELDNLGADVTADRASVVETSVDRGVVKAVVSPEPDTVLFDVRVTLRGLTIISGGDDRRVIASDLAYAVVLEGAADNTVIVEPFDLATHRTTHADPVTTRSATPGESIVATGDGFGPAVAVAALALLLLLARRRR